MIATCAGGTEPWGITVDEMALAVRTGNSIQASGKLGDLIGLTKVLFDTNHLADVGPLYLPSPPHDSSLESLDGPDFSVLKRRFGTTWKIANAPSACPNVARSGSWSGSS